MNTVLTQQYTRHDLAKIDKSKYTKEEYRRLREQKRLRRQQAEFEKLREENLKTFYPDGPPNNVLCLKHGQKYNADYVNRLYNMVSRNTTVPFKMHCITEDSGGIDPNINIIPLPEIPKDQNVNGWWYKPYIYSKELPIDGTILYFDLDIVVCANIDKLFDFYPGKYCALRDFTRSMRPGWQKYNSTVVRFERGQLDFVWTEFIKNPKAVMRRHFGDQDWLWEKTNGMAQYFPDQWIRSWKWEIRKDKTWKPGGVKGNRTFKTIENATPPEHCCIVAFHGDPNPHNCFDPYIIDNWK